MKVLVVGLGNMGKSHALAYHHRRDVEIVGLVNRSLVTLPEELRDYPFLSTLEEGLQRSPDLVCIATYSDSHMPYALASLASGAHVFIEKPLATNLKDAKRIVATAKERNRKLVVGYILRHHPSWQRFVVEARALGGPYVFRMNLNQQSQGKTWDTHKALMETTSPLVDCGVHYIDVMCQITDAPPIKVNAMGLRLSDEIAPEMYNYGHLQVYFADGSLGWYEAGWGPMISETAFFVKDIISPQGAVSIINGHDNTSDDIAKHTSATAIKVHKLNGDKIITMPQEPDHDTLCHKEQEYMINAITHDIDLTRHMNDALRSLAVCLAADESIQRNQCVTLEHL